MNLTGGSVQQGAPLPILTNSRFLLIFVQQSVQMAIDSAQGGNAIVGQPTLLAWQTLLTTVADQLNRLPVPAIFPPPRWAQLVGMATSEIARALQLLMSIPVAQPRNFPPSPGVASIPVSTLRMVQAALTSAINAIQAAEAQLGTASA